MHLSHFMSFFSFGEKEFVNTLALGCVFWIWRGLVEGCPEESGTYTATCYWDEILNATKDMIELNNITSNI